MTHTTSMPPPRLPRLSSVAGVLVTSLAIVTLCGTAVIRDDDPRPWFDRGHHDHFVWSRELSSDWLAKERAYAPRGYRFIVMRSRDEEVLDHGYRRSTSFYDFTRHEAIVVVVTKGPKRRHPCMVTTTDLSYHGAIEALEDRNASTAATSLLPYATIDGTVVPLTERGEHELFTLNPGIRAACKGRQVVDTRPGRASRSLGNADNSRVVSVLLLDGVINVREFKPPSSGSSWRRGPFDL